MYVYSLLSKTPPSLPDRRHRAGPDSDLAGPRRDRFGVVSRH